MIKPHFFGRPEFPLDQFEFGDLKLFITYNKKEIIEQWSYIAPSGVDSSLEDIGSKFIGQSLQEAFRLSTSFTGVGHAVYWQLGRLLGHFPVQEFNCTQMLCRCFGVSKQSIEQVLKKQDSIELSNIKKLTRASAGCGSCTQSLKQLVQTHCDQGPFKTAGFLSPKGEAPIQFLLKLSQWQKQQVEIKSFCLKGIAGYRVFASWDESDNALVEIFRQRVRDELRVNISLERQCD